MPTRQAKMPTQLHYMLHSGKNPKWSYYLGCALRDAVPDALFRRRLQAELDRGRQLYDQAYIDDRVDYYCHPHRQADIGADAPRIGDLHRRGNRSVYYYDSREVLQWFSPELRWRYLFGDVRTVPQWPAVVKSRPIARAEGGPQDNGNSVLLKLNRIRHFIYVDDPTPFADKLDRAIYRGHVGSRRNRAAFVERWGGHPRVDAASTVAGGPPTPGAVHPPTDVQRLTLADHLRYRYIMALEGNDVASNLKWVMSSRSVAVMPRPTCETWFMEGRLQPGVHYIEVRPDYADLIEKMDHYSSHPAEAEAIAGAANRWCDQFRDARRERYIALRVMQRYFDLTNR